MIILIKNLINCHKSMSEIVIVNKRGNNNMKKNLCRVAVVCVCLFFGGMLTPIISNAQESGVLIEPRMTYVQSYKVELTISSSGLANIVGSVIGTYRVIMTCSANTETKTATSKEKTY